MNNLWIEYIVDFRSAILNHQIIMIAGHLDKAANAENQ